MPETTITLLYKRHAELVNDKHLYTGKLSVAEGPNEQSQDFLGFDFVKMMTTLSRALRAYPDARVLLLRTERPGLLPIPLEEEMRCMLRDDPVRAISIMDFQPGSVVRPEDSRAATSTTLPVELFGPKIYLRMKSGTIEDPLTGRWGTLAYFTSSAEWAIRGPENRTDLWVRVKLTGQAEGLTADTAAKLLPACEWAEVDVEQLLRLKYSRYFLPRQWNDHGAWISKDQLQKLVDNYSKKESMQ